MFWKVESCGWLVLGCNTIVQSDCPGQRWVAVSGILYEWLALEYLVRLWLNGFPGLWFLIGWRRCVAGTMSCSIRASKRLADLLTVQLVYCIESVLCLQVHFDSFSARWQLFRKSLPLPNCFFQFHCFVLVLIFNYDCFIAGRGNLAFLSQWCNWMHMLLVGV